MATNAIPRHYTSPGARLPPEICDTIIDFLHDDKSALAACSVVAPSWTFAARYHLWRAVTISPDNVDHLLDSTHASSNTLLPYIHSIDLASAGRAHCCLSDFDLMWTRLRANVFTSLSHLSLSRVQVPPGITQGFTNLPRQITTLSLINVAFTSFTHASEFLSSFPLLEDLNLAICYNIPNDEELTLHLYEPADTPVGPSPWPSLRSCRFSQGQLFKAFGVFLPARPDIFNWISRFTPSLPLKDLEMLRLTSDELDPCAALIHASAPVLESLSLSFLTHFLSAVEIAECLQLGACMKLQRLHFRQVGLEACRGDGDMVTVALLLTQVRSQAMKEVSFTLDGRVVDYTVDEEWAMLERCLSLPAFEGVSIVFTLKSHLGDGVPEELEATIRKKLAKLDANNVISIGFIPQD